MFLFKKTSDFTNYLKTIVRSEGLIGFVPTMGALHAGHLSLIENSKQKTSVTIASIFINPTQFNDSADFAKYPVTLEKDVMALERAGCDVLFLPSVQEIYPGGTAHLPHFDLDYLETILEGKYRPGHFQGVCQVMSRLLEIVMPSVLFLGRKDYQQCMVIRKLISLKGWTMNLDIVPTLREPSGLAMSSRNMRLNEIEREKASAIYKALQFLKQEIRPGDLSGYLLKAEAIIKIAGFEKIDYVEIADEDSLRPVTNWNGQKPLVGLVAAFLNGVRLIDNITLR